MHTWVTLGVIMTTALFWTFMSPKSFWTSSLTLITCKSIWTLTFSWFITQPTMFTVTCLLWVKNIEFIKTKYIFIRNYFDWFDCLIVKIIGIWIKNLITWLQYIPPVAFGHTWEHVGPRYPDTHWHCPVTGSQSLPWSHRHF